MGQGGDLLGSIEEEWRAARQAVLRARQLQERALTPASRERARRLVAAREATFFGALARLHAARARGDIR